jgi:Spy/CpxP family protein refolding chaperone
MLALALLLGAGAAWTQDLPGAPPDDDDLAVMGDPGPWGEGAPEMREELGLTDDQKTQLRALRMKAFKENLRTRTDLQLRRLELEELLEADTVDKVAVDKAIRALAETQQGALRQRIDQRLAFRNVLTPEQRTKFRGMVERRMHARRMGMRGRHGGWGGMQGWGRRGFGAGRGFGQGEGRGPGFGPPPRPEKPPQPRE